MSFDHLSDEHARVLASIWTDDAAADEHREQTLATRTLSPTPATVRLGNAGQHTPRLSIVDYLEGEAQPPARVYRGLYPGFKDSLGNEDWGDCGEAMTVHGDEATNAAAGNPVPAYTQTDALDFYGIVGGFDPSAGPPGSNPTDNGTDNSVLVEKLKAPGLKCHADGSTRTITASMDVPVGNVVAERIAVVEFVNLFTAVGLPINAQGKQQWYLHGDGKTGDSAVGSWGYHDIPYQGYIPNGDWDANSWGMLMPVGHRWDPVYAVQHFVMLGKDILSRKGVSPTGLNYDRLVADLRKL